MSVTKVRSIFELARAQGIVRTEEEAQRLRGMTLDLGALDDLHGIDAFPSLELLSLSAAGSFSLDGIEALRALRALSVTTNGTVRGVDRLSELGELLDLRIASFRQPSVDGLRSRSLRSLHVAGALKSVAGMETPSLRFFECRQNKIADLAPFATMTSLRGLDIQGSPAKDLEPLRALTGLRSLSISGVKTKSIAALEAMQELEQLVLTFVPAKDLTVVSRLPKLHAVLDAGRATRAPASPPEGLDWVGQLRHAGYVDGAEEAARIPSLGFHFAHVPLSSFEGAHACRGLRQLRVTAPILDFAGVESLVDLLELHIGGAWDLASTSARPAPLARRFDALAELGSLRSLVSDHPIASLEVLPVMAPLEHLRLGFRDEVSLRGLDRLPALRTLCVRGPVTDAGLLESRPDLVVSRGA
jgi:hypothetical protein